MIVGGEFYEDERWLLDQPTLCNAEVYFLNGGRACLTILAAYLLDHGIQKILLPSYLCPSILDVLENNGLTWETYQILPDFSVDLADLARKVHDFQAVYFINYFGFLHEPEVQNTFKRLRENGILVVEDNAMAGFTSHPIGDFVFNSIRKLAPYDGGFLSTSWDIRPYLEQYRNGPNRRLPLIRAYRRLLSDYHYQGGDERYAELVKLYASAETFYESDPVVLGDPEERRQIEHLNWPKIAQRRRENYAYLLGLLPNLPELQPVFPALQPDVLPLGFPVYVPAALRDALVEDLGNAGIGLIIHWHELLTDTRLNQNPIAVDMASRILTLVIDQRTGHKQMDYQVQTIHDWFHKRV